MGDVGAMPASPFLIREHEPLRAEVLLSANIAATWFMVGLIWFVQVVHYPGFAAVGGDDFGPYHAAHVSRTTFVIAIPMLVEAATAVLLVWNPPAPAAAFTCWFGLALVMLIWIATAVLMVPCHDNLALGFDSAAQRSLVLGNWLRTIFWTARGLLMTSLLVWPRSAGTSP